MNDFDFSELKQPIGFSDIEKVAEDLDFSELGQPPEEKPAQAPPPKPTPKEAPKQQNPEPPQDVKKEDLPPAKELMADPGKFFNITYDNDFLSQLHRTKDRAGWHLYGGTLQFKPFSTQPGSRWSMKISSPGGYEITGKFEAEELDKVVAAVNSFYNNELDAARIAAKIANLIVGTLATKIRSTSFHFREITFKDVPIAIPKIKKDDKKVEEDAEPSIAERLDQFFSALPKEEFKRREKWPHLMIATLPADKYGPIADLLVKFPNGSITSYNWYLKKDDSLSVEDKNLSLREKMKESSLKSAEVNWAGPVLDQIAALVGRPAAAWASELAGALAAKFGYEWPTFPPAALKKK